MFISLISNGCYIVGIITTVLVSFWIGLIIAFNMKTRLGQLKELERIINYLEGEISYKHSVLREACYNASLRCKTPFNEWLKGISSEIDKINSIADCNEKSFYEIWSIEANKLYATSMLTKNDINLLNSVGQTLGYLGIKNQEMGLKLEQENLHRIINSLENELPNRMKISIMSGGLFGILLVMILM